MAARTGKGYEKHGNTFRVVWRENGQKMRRSFNTEAEAAAFADIVRPTQAVSALVSAVGPTRVAAAAKAAFIAGVMGEKPSTPTVVAYGRDLITDMQLRPNTRDMYGTALRRIEREPLGEMSLGKVTPADIRVFFRDLTANRDNVRSVLAKVFNAAVREGLIQTSPLTAAGIRPSRRVQRELRVLSAEQIEALARAAGNERDALAIRLAGYVGLRAGEVGGLRGQDVDFDRCRINVRRNAQMPKGGIMVGDPKSKASVRSLKVDCSFTDDIRRYIEKHPPLPDGTIFFTQQRNPMTNQSLTRGSILASKRAGLQPVKFHDLRHTCASLLIAQGFEPKAIQRYMGHSSIRMTYDVYGHLFPEADDPLAAGMGELRAAAERKALPAAS